jgi:hypothetical protein
LLAYFGISGVIALSADAGAGSVQFTNDFDKSNMKDTVPGEMMAELIGRNISAKTFFIASGSALLNKGKP